MNAEHNHINYIEFGGKNLEAVKAFYGTCFGWTFTDYGPDYVAFTDGSFEGGFNAEAEVSRGEPLVIIFSEKLEETKDLVASAGGSIVKDIYEFPGGRRFHFTDVVGNVLAVWGK